MLATDFFTELRARHGFTSDAQVARLLGLTSGRVSQMRNRDHELTPRQMVSYIERAQRSAEVAAIADAVRPLVEMYPLEPVASRGQAKWELLPTSRVHSRFIAMREALENVRGVYVFFDSNGRAVYVGKTERQNLWKEMTSAYNRERQSHQAFFVQHPTTGKTFSPAWQTPRQPRKRLVRLHEVAHYFSAYEVAAELIPSLEALLVRTFCNTLSNKKMERF